LWQALLPGLQCSDVLIKHLHDARDYIDWFEKLQTGARLERWLVYLLLLSGGVAAEELGNWPERLALSKRERDMLLSFAACREHLAAGLAQPIDNQHIYELLEGQAPECQVAVAVLQGEAVRQQMADYWQHLVNIRVEINGHDLLGIGLKPGPEVGEILRRLHMARLNGQVANKEQELALARQLLLTPEEGR
ncbi:MAG TPA: hypothetical protein DDZ53_12400, partial [Firmicutes bacterium]|nr:hypothetical protein [Bacillota bacterium]